MPNIDKTIFLPQLQRYDQKIKGWADNKFLTKVDTPSLPKATATTLGGVKVGNGLNVTDDGVLSAEDDIVFTWDFDTSAFSCNKTFAEVKKITTTGVRRTATVNGLLENFSITLLVVGANNDGVMFFGTAPGDALGAGMLGSMTDGTITYLFQKGLVILYNSNGQIQMTEDLSNLNTNMSFDFKSTTFQYDRTNSFDLKDGGITSTKLADGAVTADKIADGAITADKLASGVGGEKLIVKNDSAFFPGIAVFGLWTITPSEVTTKNTLLEFKVCYNSNILMISDVKCSETTKVKLTITHKNVDESMINRSGLIVYRNDGIDSFFPAENRDGNIITTNVASTRYWFSGFFFV